MSNGFANPRETWDGCFAGDEYGFGTAPNVFFAAQRPRLAARCGVAVDCHVARVEDRLWTPAAFDVVAAIFVQFAAPAPLGRRCAS